MIDPVEECNLKVAELCELLLKQAGEDREQLAALATLRSELQKANEPKACPDCGRYPGERAIQIGDTSDDKSEGE